MTTIDGLEYGIPDAAAAEIEAVRKPTTSDRLIAQAERSAQIRALRLYVDAIAARNPGLRLELGWPDLSEHGVNDKFPRVAFDLTIPWTDRLDGKHFLRRLATRLHVPAGLMDNENLPRYVVARIVVDSSVAQNRIGGFSIRRPTREPGEYKTLNYIPATRYIHRERAYKNTDEELVSYINEAARNGAIKLNPAP